MGLGVEGVGFRDSVGFGGQGLGSRDWFRVNVAARQSRV